MCNELGIEVGKRPSTLKLGEPLRDYGHKSTLVMVNGKPEFRMIEGEADKFRFAVSVTATVTFPAESKVWH